MGFLSKDDDDDVDDSFHSIPGEISVHSRQSTCAFPMLQFCWEDDKGRLRNTLIVHLPSGTYRDGCLDFKVMGRERLFLLYVNWTKFRVLDPEAYSVAFKTNTGTPLYGAGDTKIVSYRRKIRQMKGDTTHSQIKTCFAIPLEIEVVNRVTNAEGYPGFQLLKFFTKTDKIQIFVHVELMGVPLGHYTPKVDSSVDYCSSDSEEEP